MAAEEVELEDDELSAVEIEAYAIREDVVQIWGYVDAPEPLLDLFTHSICMQMKALAFVPADYADHEWLSYAILSDSFPLGTWCGRAVLAVVEGEGGERILALI